MNDRYPELRHLAQFVLACQNPSTSETARELGLAPSTLSAGLRSLEEQLGIRLFERVGRHLYPLEAATWLLQEATALLHAERYARATLARPPGPAQRIAVRLDLSFSVDLIFKALGGALGDLERDHPAFCGSWTFWSGAGGPHSRDFGAELVDEPVGQVVVGYHPASETGDEGVIPIYEDRWVLARSRPPASDPTRTEEPLLVPSVAPALVEQVIAHARAHRFLHRLRLIEDEPIRLPKLLVEQPDACFLLPRSMLARRLGLSVPHIETLHGDLVSVIGARATGHRAANDFVSSLKARLNRPECNAIFHPRITARELSYFNLVQSCGGISAAARAAGVAQPAVSAQIRKLETVLGGPLFERRREATVCTALGNRLQPVAAAMERILKGMLRRRVGIAARTQATVAIGVLPSSGHDSLMTDSIASALTALLEARPDGRFKVIEGPGAALHAAVSSGALNFAIVGTAQPQMARIALGESERLSLISHPDLRLPRRPASLAQLAALPLMLAPRELSMHRAVIAMAAERDVTLVPSLQIGSVPLTIAMVRRGRFCTVLPASAVREDLRAGRLVATPIEDAGAARSLVAIFSAERSLSELEREAIHHLRHAFRERAAGFAALRLLEPEQV